MLKEMSQKFVLKYTKDADKEIKAQLAVERTRWMEKFTFDSVVNGFLTEFIDEVAKDAVTEGRNAKIAAEKLSGLIFPKPEWMQHCAYRVIRDLWKDRKSFLKKVLNS